MAENEAPPPTRKPNAKRDLGNLSLDPTEAYEPDPESWDEQPQSNDDAAKYLVDKPPHHGD